MGLFKTFITGGARAIAKGGTEETVKEAVKEGAKEGEGHLFRDLATGLARGGIQIVTHPVNTVKGLATATLAGTAAVETVRVVHGSHKEDQSLMRGINTEVFGEQGADKMSAVANRTADVLSGERPLFERPLFSRMRQAAGADGTTALGDAASSLGETLTDGGRHPLRSLLNNITSGNIGGLSIATLVAAAMLLFSRRSGILGKVAGLVLGVTALSSMTADPVVSASAAPVLSQDTDLRMNGQKSETPTPGISLSR